MTVLVLADVFFPDTIGGAGRVARQLAEGLASEDEVVVVSRNEGGRLPPFEREGELEIHRFLVDRSVSRRFLQSAVQNAMTLVRRLSHEREFRRIVIHQPLSGVAALGLMRAIPALYVFHSPWAEEYRTQIGPGSRHPTPRHRIGMLMRNLVEGALIRQARRVMVLSNFMGGELRSLHKMPPGKTAIIPGGVDVARFTPGSRVEARAGLALPDDAEIILTVRNLMPRMGLPTLVEAFERLASHRPQAQLIIAGDGPLRGSLEAQIAGSDLTNRARLLGTVPEHLLPDLYRAADVFVMATQALEGFGLATIEALACGTPVVATPVGASPEILGQLDPTLIAASNEPADIAEVLRRFLERPLDERERVADDGRRLCTQRYRWPLITAAFNQLVRSLG